MLQNWCFAQNKENQCKGEKEGEGPLQLTLSTYFMQANKKPDHSQVTVV